MPRRLATLAILLFSLFGAVPAALACALVSTNIDCCAPDGSCGADPSQAVLTTSAACCDIQGPAQQAGMSVGTRTERLKFFSSSFNHPDAITVASLGLNAAAARSPGHESDALCLYLNQQQTYLLTARLRL
jgi:hypothetical protein